MLKSLLLSFAALLLFLAVHALVWRLRRIKRRFTVLSWVFLGATAFYVVAYCVLPKAAACSILPIQDPYVKHSSLGWDILFAVNGFVLFFFLVLAYLELYFTADRSIAIRILREIEFAPGQALSREEFGHHYDAEELVVTRRFRELEEYGYIRRENKTYRTTKKGRFTARFYTGLIDFLRLEGG
ncbi:MAG: hypothetical protein JXR37_30710 [Kiritimatiellae bacterium]|nr:hypothetical protein [Kiritimatiellia bacterium]